MKAVILAAGQGKRLTKLTNNKPKCLLDIDETNILEIQIKQLTSNGIDDIYVITGHCSKQINSSVITVVNNPQFKTTNMVYSLMQARDYLNDDLIISYGDIIFYERVLKDIIESKNKNIIVSDTNWREYWLERYNSIDFDIETFKKKDNILTEIGNEADSSSEIDGRYIGLMKFSKETILNIKKIWDMDINGCNAKIWKHTSRSIQKIFMTDMIQHLISLGEEFFIHEVKNKWCEIDTIEDYKIAQKFYVKNKHLINP